MKQLAAVLFILGATTLSMYLMWKGRDAPFASKRREAVEYCESIGMVRAGEPRTAKGKGDGNG